MRGISSERHVIYICAASVVWTLFGASIVFMELMAGIMEDLTRGALPACVWIVVVAGVLVPLTWLGTPKDFWYKLDSESEKKEEYFCTVPYFQANCSNSMPL